MHDLVINGGLIIDGTGAPAQAGDIAIDQGVISQVGGKAGPARRTLDAQGAMVTPGWIDIHTHYDGQATWDPYLSPSTAHGVTSVVMGNCGMGFAPVKPDKRDWLISVMEGVEDIPGAVLSEGIQWDWESFPEYMDALARRPKALDIATQIPHSAVRAYVMGERGIQHDETTPDDLFEMCNIVREALKAGAYGFSTSRTFLHKYDQRKYPPGTFATGEEISTLGQVLGEVGHGVLQMTSNHISMHHEIPWMRNLALKNKLPVLFNLQQTDPAPDLWKDILGTLKEAHAQNIPLYGGICGRPVGLLFSWHSSLHPFIVSPAYLEIAKLPWPERIARLRQPEVRQAILTGERLRTDERMRTMFGNFHKIYRLADNPDYEPEASESVQAMMQAQGRGGLEVVYDLMMERDGMAMLYYPSFNYSYGNLDHLHEWLQSDVTVNSLSDGGAHCNYICDVSMPTFMLTHWSRSRTRGDKFSVEAMVKRQTQDTARIYGMNDRGTLQVGKKADINIIDYDKLRLYAPEMVYDLPAGGRRLTQRCDGYIATLVAGQPIFENQQATGALPGQLMRAGQKS